MSDQSLRLSVLDQAPATVRADIEAAAQEYAADEMMVVTITHEHDARRRSYELIADEFGLVASSSAAAAFAS